MKTRKRNYSSVNSEESSKRQKTENELNTEMLMSQIESLKNELKVKDEELRLTKQQLVSKDQELKVKEQELKLKDQELLELKEKGHTWEEKKKIDPRKSPTIIQNPTDPISLWICNPGLDFLSHKIFGLLDIRSLVQCKKVSNIWNNFINHDKKLLIFQVQQMLHLPITMINRETYEKFESTIWATHVREKSKPEWERMFQLIEFERFDVIMKMFEELQVEVKSAKEGTIMLCLPKDLPRGVKSNCLDWNMSQTFQTLCKEFKTSLNDIWEMESYLTYGQRITEKTDFKPIKEIFNVFAQNGVNMNELAFKLYRKYDKKVILVRLLENLLQSAKEYGINFNATNNHGRTLKEQAEFDKNTDVVELFEKYEKRK